MALIILFFFSLLSSSHLLQKFQQGTYLLLSATFTEQENMQFLPQPHLYYLDLTLVGCCYLKLFRQWGENRLVIKRKKVNKLWSKNIYFYLYPFALPPLLSTCCFFSHYLRTFLDLYYPQSVQQPDRPTDSKEVDKSKNANTYIRHHHLTWHC